MRDPIIVGGAVFLISFAAGGLLVPLIRWLLILHHPLKPGRVYVCQQANADVSVSRYSNRIEIRVYVDEEIPARETFLADGTRTNSPPSPKSYRNPGQRWMP